ncbi:MAG TPA: flagellar hook capping FlgD N-terminal domain-containing protein [Steroidobacteraceae bacterium]|nr:flagellar hook capping FlgD N-terminal domain-containing protein [Steroidobacteraceae bacterium]
MIIQHTQAAAQGAGATNTGTAASGSSGAAGSTGSSSSGNGAVAGVSLGGTNFLTLMLAQLKNQDPTSPVDSNAFLTQLAQLSEVQGIQQLNTSFSALQSSLVSSQALQASSLLGHQAMVASSTGSLSAAGASLSGAVGVPQTSSQVTLNISNASGVLVQSINLGAQSAGLANFTWNGQMANGAAAPPGTYTLSAQVAGTSGGSAISTYVSGTIESVTMGGAAGSSSGSSGLTLTVSGLGNVPFSSVQQILN